MDKLFIHIGPHKTGSTYIQKMFFGNRDKLREYGICYPPDLDGPFSLWGHHNLVWSIQNRLENSVDELVSQFERINILSSENFEYLTESEVLFFANKISSFNIELIYLKRCYSELLVSNWQEDIKHGSHQSWQDFLASHFLQPFQSPILNSSIVIKRWSSIIDFSKIHIVDYDLLMSYDLDISEFCLQNIVGLKSPLDHSKTIINRSMEYAAVELLRMLNLKVKLTGKTVDHNVRNIFNTFFKNEDTDLINSLNIIRQNLALFTMEDIYSCEPMEQYFESQFDFKRGAINYGKKSYALPSEMVPFIPALEESVDALLLKILTQL